jgi:translation initiation factor 5B
MQNFKSRVANQLIMDKEYKLRSPIVSVLGHVDHGKSSILDAIRESNIVSKEAGAITQAIGASIVPLEVIMTRCASVLGSAKMNFTIPGLLFIDTPGHAAFTSLRKRGGALADIAILVVDVNEGFKPQTLEAVEILKGSKTPFIIAANKVDLVKGFNAKSVGQPCSLAKLLSGQSSAWLEALDERLYYIIGQLYENFQFSADRYDRVEDYTKHIAVVPCSAKSGTGIAECLLVITGLAQKYLESSLRINAGGPAKGTILEVKDVEGLGRAIDVIIYDGMLNLNDTIVLGSVGEPIVTRVRALFQPAPLHEMRDSKSSFVRIKQAVAATGVRISAPNLENAIAGMPLVESGSSASDLAVVKATIKKEISEVLFESSQKGLIVKADSLGSVEAVVHLFKDKGLPVKRASIGEVTKKDLLDAEANYDADPLLGVIIAFNVSLSKGAEVPKKVKVLQADVIYKLLDDYSEWIHSVNKVLEADQVNSLTRPCKLEILPNCIFRQSNPAVVGVFVMAGTLKVGMPLMKKGSGGRALTYCKSIQAEQESLTIAEKGKQVAVSLPDVVCGRQIKEEDILYSLVPEEDFRKLKKLKKYLSADEVEAMREIAEIMRLENVVWGV